MTPILASFSIDKVDTEAVQYQAPKNKVCKRPFGADIDRAVLHEFTSHSIDRLGRDLLRRS